ncbi:alpha/beta hydrolase [Pseudooceanicola sp.]
MGKLALIGGLLRVLGPTWIARATYRGKLDVVDGRAIDPKAKAAGDLVNMLRDINVMPPLEESRAQLDMMATKFDQPCPADVITRDITLPGLTGGRAARLYVPAGGDPMAGQPTLLYLHGGGWVQGSLTSHHSLCGKLAKQGNLRVISYDYVLAPEHKFPAASDDILMVYKALLDGTGGLGVQPDSLIVGGDSAGGNLTAALMHDLSGAGLPLPAGQLLIYPAVDGRMTSRSIQALAQQPLLPKSRIGWFLDLYLPEGQDRQDPRFSPLFSDHLAGQPPALILAGGHDPLYDDGVSYAAALREAGVEVQLIEYEGQVHAFLSLTKAIPQGREAIARCATWLRQRLGT